MKSIIGAFVAALLLVCLALPNLVFAGAEGATATGSFKFAMEDGETKYVEFKATELADGQATGEMTLSDPSAAPVEDPDNPEEKPAPGIIVRAKFDCMETGQNTAVLGGEIYDANVKSAIGQRILLVVEDNGVEGEKDRLTWGIFQQPATGWTPSDAELDDDKGASLSWTATDAELKEDVGIKMPLSKLVQCKTFPASTLEFPEFKYTGGDLQVQTKQ
jgi:hypothetical protein